MAKKDRIFYAVNDYGSSVRNGSQISVQRHMAYQGEHADFTPLLTVPHKELEQRLKDSMAEEKKVFDDVETRIKAWDEHGAQTLLLQKAIEYLKTPVVKHTANEWKQGKDGTWEVSNLVYKMTFNITKSGDEFKLAWELQYTAPGLPERHYYYPGDGVPRKRIEYEGSKKYKTMEGAQKYIQSKFDQYAACFEALSPPVPVAVKSLFCVNGQLLQGYSAARTEVKKEKTVSVADLLSCLGDEDMTHSTTAQAAPLEKPPQAPSEKASAQKPAHHKQKKKSAPAR